MVQFEQLELHTKHKTFHIPGVHNVPLYVTDQHPPKRPRAAFSFIVPEGIGLIDKECAPAYYNASFALKLNSAMEINRSKF